MARKVALVTGITGQDRAYLSDLLIHKGYEVHGIVRRSSLPNTGRILHLLENEEIRDEKLFLHFGDMTDTSSLSRIMAKIEPDEGL